MHMLPDARAYAQALGLGLHNIMLASGSNSLATKIMIVCGLARVLQTLARLYARVLALARVTSCTVSTP